MAELLSIADAETVEATTPDGGSGLLQSRQPASSLNPPPLATRLIVNVSAAD
jgi:hypothetical protein